MSISRIGQIPVRPLAHEVESEKTETGVSPTARATVHHATNYGPMVSEQTRPATSISSGDLPAPILQDDEAIEGDEEAYTGPSAEEIDFMYEQIDAEIAGREDLIAEVEKAWERLLDTADAYELTPELEQEIAQIEVKKNELVAGIETEIEELNGYLEELGGMEFTGDFDGDEEIWGSDALDEELEREVPPLAADAQRINFGASVPGGETDLVISLGAGDHIVRVIKHEGKVRFIDEDGNTMDVSGNRRIFFADEGGETTLIVSPEVDRNQLLVVSDESSATYGVVDGIEKLIVSNQRYNVGEGGFVHYQEGFVDSEGVLRAKVDLDGGGGDVEIHVPDTIDKHYVKKAVVTSSGGTNEWMHTTPDTQYTVKYYDENDKLIGEITYTVTNDINNRVTFYHNDNGMIGDYSGVTNYNGVAVYGGNEGDKIIGSAYGDAIHGRKGNDWIEGRGGSDNIYGEDGDDIIKTGDGADYVKGGEGNDLLVDNSPNGVTMYGNEGLDKIWVANEEGDDSYYNNDGLDQINKDEGGDQASNDTEFAVPYDDEALAANQFTTDVTAQEDSWESEWRMKNVGNALADAEADWDEEEDY